MTDPTTPLAPAAASTRVMGVLNVTPDSFSDGGLYLGIEAALERARELVAQGAHIIDIGGESTRPGAAHVSPPEEQGRVIPVIRALVAEGIVVSIDTVNASTARLAVAAGASLINDVSGGTADPLMRAVAAESGADYVVMHWRGIPDPAHSRSQYSDVVTEVRDELARLADAAVAAGVQPERLILDPGLGFDKTAEQGWQLLAGISHLSPLGHRVLVGVSRKRILAETLAAHGLESGMPQRDVMTAAVSALAAREGIWGVRVHEVEATAAAIAAAEAWVGGGAAAPSVSSVSPVSSASSEEIASRCCLEQLEAASTGNSLAGQARSAGQTAGQAKLPADRITLTGLEVFAYHGVFDFEREQGQRFAIDAEIAVDLHAAAQGDELASTVHYGELATKLKAAAESDPVDLIETLAERLAQVALGFDGVRQARITVHKPDAPIEANFADVSVTVVRERGWPT